MNIFPLPEDPVNGTTQNVACVAKIGSIEPFEFAFGAGAGDQRSSLMLRTEIHYSEQPMRRQFRSASERQSGSSRLLAERSPGRKHEVGCFASKAFVINSLADRRNSGCHGAINGSALVGSRDQSRIEE